MELRKKKDSDDESKEPDPTAEMLDWAKDRIATVSETTPGKMGPPAEGTSPEPEPQPSTSQSMPSRVKPPAAPTPSLEGKLLVVALQEGTSEWGQVHLLHNAQEASHFVETLVNSGLDSTRITVFQGAPMNVNVTYRAVVAIEQGDQEPPASD